MRFATQDICLSQLQHTITYAMAFQYWAKQVHPPVPGQLHHLVGSVQELWQVMELLVSFGEEEVFVTTVPSNWTEVTLPQSMETTAAASTGILEVPHPQCQGLSERIHDHATQSKGRPAATAMQATAAMEAPVQLHHGSLGHTSLCLTPGPYAHHQGSQKLPRC